MQKYRDIAIDNSGNAILSATITVTNSSGGGVAVIYSDNVGTSLANPFTSSAVDGAYEFYAENGRYDVTVTKTGYDTETITDITLFDGDEAVESYANIAALRAITLAPQTTHAKIKGYYTDGDGGGGDFYWDSTSTETDNGGTIIKATAITTGRWKRLFSGAVNVKWFGAKGDGTTDDSAAIQGALNLGEDVGLTFDGGQTYKINSTLTWTGDKLSIKSSNGIKFKFLLSTATSLFDIDGTADVATTTLAADAANNDKTITVTSATGAAVGQLVELESSLSWYYDPRPGTADVRKGELHIVTKVDGTTIWLDSVVCDTYTIASETVTVSFHDPAQISLEGFIVEYPKDTSIQSGVGGNYLINSSIRNVEVHNAGISGMGAGYSKNVIIDSCYVQGCNVIGTGYGTSIGSSSGVIITSTSYVECRTGPDFTGKIPSRFCSVDNCIVHGGGNDTTGSDMFASGLQRGMGGHGGSEHLKFTNNKISKVWTGIASRGGSCVIEGNQFYGEMRSCVTIFFGEDVIVTNNTHNMTDLRNTAITNEIPDYFVWLQDDTEFDGRFDISNNCGTVSYAFVEIDSTAGTFTNLYINNNRCRIYGAVANPAFIEGNYTTSSNASFGGESNIRDNIVSVLNGTLTHYKDTGAADRARYTKGLDAFLFDDATKLVAVSGGSLANVTVKLTTSLNDGIATVTGRVLFDVVTSPTQIRIDDLPVAEDLAVLNMRYYDGAAYQQGTVYINSSGVLAIGSTAASATATFPVGTGYVLYIDISYDSPY